MFVEDLNTSKILDYNKLTHLEFAICATSQLFHGNYQYFVQWKDLMQKDNCPKFTREIPKVIQHYKTQAEQALNDPTQQGTALTFLGLVYYTEGHCGVGDKARARELIEKACALNHGFAMCIYSDMLISCTDSPDFDGAIATCKKAVRLGENYAPILLAGLYMAKSILPEESEILLRQGVQVKNISALRKLGRFLKPTDVPTALALFQEAAELGDLQSIAECIDIYFSDANHKDIVLCIFYWEKLSQYVSQTKKTSRIFNALYQTYKDKNSLEFAAMRLTQLMFEDLMLNRPLTTATLNFLKKSKAYLLEKIRKEPCNLETLKRFSHPEHAISQILELTSEEYQELLYLITVTQHTHNSVNHFFSKQNGFSDDPSKIIMSYMAVGTSEVAFFSNKSLKLPKAKVNSDSACCTIS